MSRPKTRPYLRLDRAFRCEARWDLLSTDGQRLAWMILTDSTSTSLPGLLRMRRSTLLEDSRMTSEAFDAAWAEVEAHRYARADWARGLVWILDGLTHNPPANADAILGWRTNWLALPECGLRDEAEAYLRAEVSRLARTWPKGGAVEALAEVFGGDGDTVSDRVSDTVSDRVSHTVEGSTPPPGSGSGSGSRTETETKTGGEGERERAASAAASGSALAHPPVFSKVEGEKSERPARVKRVGKPVRMPVDFTPSAECMAPLAAVYRQSDLDAELVKFRKHFGNGRPHPDWNQRFKDWILEADEERHDIHKKPPPCPPKPKQAAEPAPSRPTPDEHAAMIASLEQAIGPLEPETFAPGSAGYLDDETRAGLGWGTPEEERAADRGAMGPMDARIPRRLAKTTPDAANDGDEAVS